MDEQGRLGFCLGRFDDSVKSIIVRSHTQII